MKMVCLDTTLYQADGSYIKVYLEETDDQLLATDGGDICQWLFTAAAIDLTEDELIKIKEIAIRYNVNFDNFLLFKQTSSGNEAVALEAIAIAQRAIGNQFREPDPDSIAYKRNLQPLYPILDNGVG